MPFKLQLPALQLVTNFWYPAVELLWRSVASHSCTVSITSKVLPSNFLNFLAEFRDLKLLAWKI
jgi:hypothetical protein